ncbi:MAG: hypothetical protein EOM36_10065 [Bacteroidia bacterium]|nr:hypothetical protein [Bacteroidia bacterium]
MKCPRCGSGGVRAYVTVLMYIDADDNGNLTKRVLRKKSTELWAQEHDKTSYVCRSCGKSWGYGYNEL